VQAREAAKAAAGRVREAPFVFWRVIFDNLKVRRSAELTATNIVNRLCSGAIVRQMDDSSMYAAAGHDFIRTRYGWVLTRKESDRLLERLDVIRTPLWEVVAEVENRSGPGTAFPLGCLSGAYANAALRKLPVGTILEELSDSTVRGGGGGGGGGGGAGGGGGGHGHSASTSTSTLPSGWLHHQFGWSPCIVNTNNAQNDQRTCIQPLIDRTERNTITFDSNE
jgi:hypothetical protein